MPDLAGERVYYSLLLIYPFLNVFCCPIATFRACPQMTLLICINAFVTPDAFNMFLNPLGCIQIILLKTCPTAVGKCH